MVKCEVELVKSQNFSLNYAEKHFKKSLLKHQSYPRTKKIHDHTQYFHLNHQNIFCHSDLTILIANTSHSLLNCLEGDKEDAFFCDNEQKTNLPAKFLKANQPCKALPSRFDQILLIFFCFFSDGLLGIVRSQLSAINYWFSEEKQ